MQQDQERRPRRRGLWRLLAVPALLVLAGTASAAIVGSSSTDHGKSATAGKAPEGTSIVSPPLATTPTAQPAAGGSGTGGNRNSGNGTNGISTSASNNGNGNGNGNANGNANGKSLTVTFVSATPLYPGSAGTLTLQVANTNQQDVLLSGVSSTVTSVTTGTTRGIPRCDKSWIQIGGLQGTPLVRGRSSRTITVPVTMVNTTGVNQDNCKGVTYSFSFTVNGRQA